MARLFRRQLFRTAAVLALAAGCSPLWGADAPGQSVAAWKVGTPLVTYWAGPAMTDAVARQMAEGGWNVVWCTEKELDVAQRHGLRAQLSDGLLSPATLDNPAVSVTGLAQGGYTVTIQYSGDSGSNWTTGDTPLSDATLDIFSGSLNLPTDGYFYLRAFITVGLTNYYSDSVLILLDSAQPAATITSPLDGAATNA